jgi:hypothetical protein
MVGGLAGAAGHADDQDPLGRAVGAGYWRRRKASEAVRLLAGGANAPSLDADLLAVYLSESSHYRQPEMYGDEVGQQLT